VSKSVPNSRTAAAFAAPDCTRAARLDAASHDVKITRNDVRLPCW
jgi:hypothetical protein